MPGVAAKPVGKAYASIRAVVARIPRGNVATYGQIAALGGYPHAPRLGGYALYNLGPGSPLPWHRVLGAGGRLTLGRLSPEAALTQRLRLESEGVTFDGRGRVVMARHQWKPGASSPRGRIRAGTRTAKRGRPASRRSRP